MSEALQPAPGSRRRVPRTRGAASGVLLMLLGAWGGLVPFIGPLFDFAFTPQPNTAWHWTAARGWYEVLPGGVAFLGGLLLLISTSRLMTMIGAWLAIAAGAWFIIGPAIATELTLGSIGAPTGSSSGLRAIEALSYFYLLGAVILFLASAAFGRLSVVTVRDIRVAERREDDRREAERAEAEELAARDAAAREVVMSDGEQRWGRDQAEREAAERAAAERDAANQAAAQPTTDTTDTSGAHAYPTDAATPDSGYGQTTYAQHQSDQPSGYPSAPPPPPPPSSSN